MPIYYNPETGRKITKNGATYTRLRKKYSAQQLIKKSKPKPKQKQKPKGVGTKSSSKYNQYLSMSAKNVPDSKFAKFSTNELDKFYDEAHETSLDIYKKIINSKEYRVNDSTWWSEYLKKHGDKYGLGGDDGHFDFSKWLVANKLDSKFKKNPKNITIITTYGNIPYYEREISFFVRD
jgi:hypothetical protein